MQFCNLFSEEKALQCKYAIKALEWYYFYNTIKIVYTMYCL